MLARPETQACTECGHRYGSADFAYHHGRIEDGAAYWSDRGLLCSAECSTTHYRKRAAAGTMPAAPVDDPTELTRG